jgi:hypothetical protein
MTKQRRVAIHVNEQGEWAYDDDYARLIAAAPDLLAALKECRRVLGIRNDFVPLGHATTLARTIDAAIAKAEGTGV